METVAQKRKRRHERIRAKISGTKECPRLAVFRSNKHISVQLIDDTKGVTLLSSSDSKLTKKGITKAKDIAQQVGKDIAKQAGEKKITHIVFDRGGFKYGGSIKALAEGAREGGLLF